MAPAEPHAETRPAAAAAAAEDGSNDDVTSKKPAHARKSSLGDVAGFSRADSNPLRKGLPKRMQSLSQLLDQWVAESGGDRPIHSVLVANNGLAAVKFMRSVRAWATQTLGHAKAILLVAMATPNDIRINAEHIQLSDQFVEVPGGSNNNNYANVSLIVQVAERAGVDAVWPGWGHASENPDLPAALAERNIRFLGPGSVAMAALGDKIGSTILAQAAGVPTLPWSGTGVAISFSECDGVIPPQVYEQACIHSVEEALASCQAIGYPIMLKASWGGGGKGIRKVHSDDEVRQVFRQVQGEVPGSPIFAMKLAPISRHLEVQLLCDMHGNVASLMSRDCSVQRRHQKIVEEGPVSAASPEELASMEKCARALARSVGYVGAATVEFLYCIDEKKYCFLELNPRLQVEHPVTEGITGVNIPACQLMVGMGIPLYRIPAIRSLYCQDPRGTEPFDLDSAPQKPPDCHVVAVRITAEDANDGFKPTCGRIDELHFRPTPEVWAYFSVKSGGGIHEYSDSQFGHMFAKGETREAALRNLVVALRDIAIRGEIRTIIDYALDMVQSKDLIGNNIHTGWLDSRIARKVHAGRPPWHLAVIAGAVVKAYEHISSLSVEYLGYLSKGQLPPASVSLTLFSDTLVIEGTKFAVRVARSGPTAFSVALGGSAVEVRTRKMADGGFLLQVDGESHVVHVEEETLGTRLMIDSLTCLLSKEADPSRLVATSPCKLVRHLVASGDHVEQNAPYAEVEVMKMMMPLLAPAAGVISFMLPEGVALAAGDLIASLQLDDPRSVVRAEPFLGTFPELGPPVVPSARLDQRFKQALEGCTSVMAGYVQRVEELVPELVACLDSPALPLLQWEEELAVIRSRLPGDLPAVLDALLAPHAAEVHAHEALAQQGLALPLGAVGAGAAPVPFPAAGLLKAMTHALEIAPASEQAALAAMLAPLQALANQHLHGKEEYARTAVMQLFDALLAVEEAFAPSAASGAVTEQEVIDGLRRVHAGNLQAVLDMVLSHQGLSLKVQLALRLMAVLVLPAPAPYRPQLRRFAALRTKGAEELVLRAQALLEHSLMADMRVVVARALSGLDMFRGDAAAAVGPGGHCGVEAADAARLDLDLLASPLASPTAAPGGAVGLGVGAVGAGRVASAFASASGHAASSAAGGLTSPPAAAGGGIVARTTTTAEGMYVGLTPVQRSSSTGPASPAGISRAGTWQIEAKMEMLVGVQAAVDDALASLLVDGSEPELQARAASTYLRRLYHPYVVRDPVLKLHHPPHQPPSAATGAGAGAVVPGVGGGVGGAPWAGIMTGVWLYDDPLLSHSSASRTCAGGLLLLEGLWALPAGLEQLAGELQATELGPLPLALHIALAGGQTSLRPPSAPADGRGPGSGKVVVDELPALIRRCELGGEEDPSTSARAAEVALGAALTACFARLTDLNVASVSLVARSGGSSLPLRAGFAWDPELQGYRCDRFGRQAESITSTLLELPKLRNYRQLQYTPSRNRQWHMFTGVERPDARSYPLRRMYVRGALRQLGHPALLAASYSGNVSAVATAVVHELEEGLVSCLEELSRLQNAATADDASSDSLSGRPDWTHIFITVLPPMPTLHSSPSFSTSTAALFGASSASPGGAAADGGAADPKISSTLRAAVATLVAKHMGAFRKAAVAQLEVRLRAAQGSPAWRLVAMLPTGHEHGEEHVEVYREVLPTGGPVAEGETLAGPLPGLEGVVLQPLVTPSRAASGNAAPGAVAAPTSSPSLLAVNPVGHSPLGPCPGALSLVAASTHALSGSASALRLDSAPTLATAPHPWSTPSDSSSGGPANGSSASGASATLHGQPVLGPYPALEPLQQRRLAARRHAVTYCYDFPSVFEDVVREAWASRAAAGEPCSVPPAPRLVEVEELVLAPGVTDFRQALRLQRTGRPIGSNDCGMVAWLMTLRTPECPQGRQVVVVANDITFQSGAFSPREDAVFRSAAELSLEQRLPLLYLAANSGARVGLATEVRSRLRVQWVDEAEPSKGFAYLYLSASDHEELQAMARAAGTQVLKAVPRPAPGNSGAATGAGEVHWVLQDVVGLEDGLGVECLSGSGAIASAYARAFREGYTATLVSGRTVGIGAYLARLGRRCVQRADQPIILTGYSALNKLLGRQVYTSQMQLGGPRVMGFNGVSHHVVRDDLEGVATLLKLLAFVPADLAGDPPLLPSADPVDRLVGYAPLPGEKLDPRAAIAGCAKPPSTAPPAAPANGAGPGPTAAAPSNVSAWQSGLFDAGSWLESHAGWACTVVTGRARLGGQPVGVIAVETQTVLRQQPADPGMPDSSEQTIPQAGQVWYPDSAQKTALAMEEFNLEGLPLFVLANWRGFSGGQRDLFEGVLQAGSLIVEQLRTYRRPTFVYIPCTAELRGGAWVVVDSQINSACVEMYADPGARGGVLEPEGVVEIKFRKPDLLRMMHRVDPVLLSLTASGSGKGGASGGEASAAAIRAREKLLLPIYQQVARQFADMHDTPVRMLAKGVIRSIVPWRRARAFFATRLKRRLMEETLVHHVQSTDASVAHAAALALVRSWYAQACTGTPWPQQPSSPANDLSLQMHGLGGAGSVPAVGPAAERDEAELFCEQMQEDAAFLTWAESSAGRMHIAQELRGLRTRSAMRIVTQVLGTSEGRDGLLKSLQGAAKKDTVLAMQLRMMLTELGPGNGIGTGPSARVGAGACVGDGGAIGASNKPALHVEL